MKTLPSDADSAKNSFDRIDLALLRELLRDSRQSLAELGGQVGLSATACWNRIRRLEEAGVIKRYTVELDEEKLGWRDTVIVQVTLESHSQETLEAFGQELAAIPEVVEAYLVSGDYDYTIRVAVRDTRDYERLLREKLYRIPGIRHSRSHFVLRVLKERTEPLLAAAPRAG